VLASYFLAQSAVNQLADPFDSPDSGGFGSVFTGAFMVRTPQAFPTFEAAALQQFCKAEWGEDGPDACEAILAAHAFFAAGMAEVTIDYAVVFIIS
jgi:hypothetical protein